MRLASAIILACLVLLSLGLSKQTTVYRSQILLVPGPTLQAQVDAAGENTVLACAVGETYSAPEIRLKRGQVLMGHAARWTCTVYPAPNGRIEGAHFIGATSGVILSNCWCVTVRDCVFNGSWIGVSIVGTDSVVDAAIDRCRLSNGQFGVIIEGGTHISIRVRDCSFEAYPYGVAVRGYTIGSAVSGCHFESIRCADIVVDHDDATSTLLAGNVHIRPVCPVLLSRGNGCTISSQVIRGDKRNQIGAKFRAPVIQ